MPICFTNLSFMAKRFCNSFYGRKFYGFYYWLKGKQQDHDIRIEPIAVQTAIIQMIIAAVGGLLFGLVLKTLPMQRCQCLTHSLQHLVCLQLTDQPKAYCDMDPLGICRYCLCRHVYL